MTPDNWGQIALAIALACGFAAMAAEFDSTPLDRMWAWMVRAVCFWRAK